METFADQAAIAIENAHLLTELQAKNADLSDTLARQTATAEVLRAISRAQTDAQPVFDIITASALRLCGADASLMALRDGELLQLAAIANVSPEGAEAIRSVYPMRRPGETAVGRAIRSRAVVQVPDATLDATYEVKTELQTAHLRSVLGVPMLRDAEPIGVIVVMRREPG